MSKSHGWEEIGLEVLTCAPEILQTFRETHTKFFTKGACRVLLSREPRPDGKKVAYHMSISCADRNPTWEEIKDARYSLMPLGIPVVMILPKPDEYVNIHEYCFHLWEWEGLPA